jgi:hypothetical protein
MEFGILGLDDGLPLSICREVSDAQKAVYFVLT